MEILKIFIIIALIFCTYSILALWSRNESLINQLIDNGFKSNKLGLSSENKKIANKFFLYLSCFFCIWVLWMILILIDEFF